MVRSCLSQGPGALCRCEVFQNRSGSVSAMPQWTPPKKHTQSKTEGFKLPLSSGFNGMSGGLKVHGSTCVTARLPVKFKNCSLR